MLSFCPITLKLCCDFSLSLSLSLPPVQGDGISYETITVILEHMKKNKWSADNVAFGSGGSLLQKLHRDTQKCAYKCSYAIINGEGVSEYNYSAKEPHPCIRMSLLGFLSGFIIVGHLSRVVRGVGPWFIYMYMYSTFCTEF